MKGISLHEPLATAVRLDLKRNETRGFRIHHRGPLVICAARTTLHGARIFEEKLQPYFERVGITKVEQLAFGCIVAVCRVSEVIPVEQMIGRISDQELVFGDYSPGRFAWVLADLRGLKKPIPFRGTQGIFNVPREALEGAEYL